MAAALGTTRASINVHLSNLGKKGVILGRGYVLAERPGAVVDRWREHGPQGPQQGSGDRRDQQPGPRRDGARRAWPATSPRTWPGSATGCTWSASWAGTRWARACLSHTAAAGVRIEHVARTDRPTGTYTAVLDADGELLVAIADMDATAELGPEQLQAARDVIATRRRAGARRQPRGLTPSSTRWTCPTAARTVFEPGERAQGGRPQGRPRRPGLRRHPEPRRARGAHRSADAHRPAGAIGVGAHCTPAGIELVWVRLGERARCSARPTR